MHVGRAELVKDLLYEVIRSVLPSPGGRVRLEQSRLERTGEKPGVLRPARPNVTLFCVDLMNGMTGARRMARPVRLALARQLGSPLDGAWWPYTGSVADELPGLIEALHRPLGEIVDLRVNWSATEGALDFDSILNGAGSKKVTPRRRHRLMVVVGRTASVKLLVLPHMTTPALGIMVMRCAAARPLDPAQQDSQWCTAAREVVSDAHAQSALWTDCMTDTAAN